jgi:glycogen(starch) synthase
MWARNVFPDIGGVQRVIHDLTDALIARGHEVATIAGMPSDDRSEIEESEHGKLWHVDMAAAFSSRDLAGVVAAVQRVRGLLRAFAPDVIHFHPSGPEVVVVNLIRAKTSIPMVTTVHLDMTMPSLKRDRSSLLDTLTHSSATIAISSATATNLAGLYPQLRNVRCIANAVRANANPFTAPQGRRLFAIGRAISEKGFDLAIGAMPHILAAVPDAELVIAGDGQERPKLQAQVCALGLTQHVFLPGWIAPEAVLDEMRNAIAVLMPSRWNEPFGIVALEAAWAGRPVIALNRGGLPEIVRDGETGFLLPGEDPAVIAVAAVRLLRDPLLAAQMGSAARKHAETAFDFARFVEDHVSLYERVISAQHGISVASDSR